MKILVISRLPIVSYANPGGYGGAAFQKPTSELLNMGCNIRVIAPVTMTPFPIKYLTHKWMLYSKIPDFEKVDGVDVFHPRYLSLPKSFLMSYAGIFMYFGIRQQVRRLHREYPFDLIHAHHAFPDGYAGLLVGREYQKPLVIAVRGTDIDITAKRNRSCLRRLKTVLNQSAAVVAPSPRLGRALNQRFGIKGVNIFNGIDVEEICSVKGDTTQKENNRIVLLSVSQLIPSKGIDLNIMAIQSLILKYRNLLYLIIGDGLERKKLEQLVTQSGLNNFVKFKGTLPHSDAMKFMASCDIFTMPSWQETFGLVYLEAMAFGKPVIGCRGQGMDNIITEEKVGLLAEPKDWHSVADALDFLISNPEKARMMGERGRKLVLENYTFKKNAERTFELYRTVLKNGSIPNQI